MTGKSYGPTEMIIRGLPGWLAWFAGCISNRAAANTGGRHPWRPDSMGVGRFVDKTFRRQISGRFVDSIINV